MSWRKICHFNWTFTLNEFSAFFFWHVAQQKLHFFRVDQSQSFEAVELSHRISVRGKDEGKFAFSGVNLRGVGLGFAAGSRCPHSRHVQVPHSPDCTRRSKLWHLQKRMFLPDSMKQRKKDGGGNFEIFSLSFSPCLIASKATRPAWSRGSSSADTNIFNIGLQWIQWLCSALQHVPTLGLASFWQSMRESRECACCFPSFKAFSRSLLQSSRIGNGDLSLFVALADSPPPKKKEEKEKMAGTTSLRVMNDWLVLSLSSPQERDGNGVSDQQQVSQNNVGNHESPFHEWLAFFGKVQFFFVVLFRFSSLSFQMFRLWRWVPKSLFSCGTFGTFCWFRVGDSQQVSIKQ